MAPKSLNGNSNYKDKSKLDLERLKKNDIQNAKINLNSIRTLASQTGALSQDVKRYMKLLTLDRYYALNDRTINLLMKGDIDVCCKW